LKDSSDSAGVRRKNYELYVSFQAKAFLPHLDGDVLQICEKIPICGSASDLARKTHPLCTPADSTSGFGGFLFAFCVPSSQEYTDVETEGMADLDTRTKERLDLVVKVKIAKPCHPLRLVLSIYRNI
jgi:hypothetical protein